MEEIKNIDNPEVIDLREVAKKIWARRKLMTIALIIAFVLACVWILPQPRYYTAEVTLAPEMENIAGGGGLADIAASFGFDVGGGTSSDAIYPTLYPDLMQSSEFILGLFDVQVKNEDGDVNTDYYTYLTKHQKKNIWMAPVVWVKKLIKQISPKKEQLTIASGSSTSRFNPFCLTEKQDNIVNLVRDNITCDVDLKTSVITIRVVDQDRLICASMADSVRMRLQDYITDYRTKKARHDYAYYQELTEKAKRDYENALAAYSQYTDTHKDVMLQAYISQRDKLENEVEMKYQSYTAFVTQLQAAEAKVRERTPAFTTLQCATVPQKPFRPKRMIFVLTIMFLTAIGVSLYILRDDLKSMFLSSK